MRAPVLAASILALPATALPCGIDYPGRWERDPAEALVDFEPPGPARLRSLEVTRGMQALFDGSPVDSCGERKGQRGAELLVHLELPVDDRTPSTEIAFRQELVGPHLPPGYEAGTTFEEFTRNGTIRLTWFERDDDDLLDFTMRLTPLDAAGNEGPRLDVHVRDEGVGCSAAGGGPSLLPLLVALGALRFRR